MLFTVDGHMYQEKTERALNLAPSVFQGDSSL